MLLAAFLFALGTQAQAITELCGLPADPKCLVKNAQYTVVGNIRSTNLNDSTSNATPTNYNATMNIRCVLASFSNPVSPGEGLVGKEVLVTNWGLPKTGCPRQTGSQAVVGQDMIYFIYVQRSLGPQNQVFSVQPICVGGVGLDNINAVAEVVAEFPSNSISAQNRGTDPFCNLAAAKGNSTTTTSSPEPTFTPKSSSDRLVVSAFATFVVAAVALTL